MLGYRCLAFAAANLGDDREAQRLAHHSIAQADRIGAPFFRLAGLLVLATTGISLGEHHQAEAYPRENLGILRAHGITVYVSLAVMLIGVAAAGQGDYLRARACFRRSLTAQRELGQFLVSALQNIGAVELSLGNLAQARRFYREALELSEAQGSTPNLTLSLTGLARIALARSDLGEARKHLLSALQNTRADTPAPAHNSCHRNVGRTLQAEGQLEAATELCSALVSWPATPIFAPQILRSLRTDLEARLQGLAGLLPTEVFAAALERGRQRQIDEVVAQLLSAS